MNTFQKAILILFCGYLAGILVSYGFALRITQLQIPYETATLTPPHKTNTPTPQPTPVTTPTAYPTPLIINYVSMDLVGVDVSAQDAVYLAALCVVETKSLRELRDDACKSVVSTVLIRAIDHNMSDGTVAGTLTWNCKPEDIACQFPAYVVNGCDGIQPDKCPYNYPQLIVHFVGVVEDFLKQDADSSCLWYPFYDLREAGTDCRIEENGQFINFHDGLD